MKILQSHIIWSNIVLLITILFIHIRYYKKNLKIIFLYLFLISVISYHIFWLMLVYEMYHISAFIFYNGMNLLSYFFWLFSLSLFLDHFRLNQFHITIGILKIIIGNGIVFLSLYTSSIKETFLLLNQSYYYQIPNILFSFVLILHSLYIAYKEKDSDLIVWRIDIRKFYVFIIGGFIIWILMYYLVLRPLSFTLIFNLINAIIILLLCLLFFLFGLPYLPLVFSEKENIYQKKSKLISSSQNSKLENDTFPEEILRKVIDMFEKNQIFKEEGLTIRKLSRYLNIQEYKLRNMINQGLGYKNFNELLNYYRIQEAKKILSDTSLQDIPITRIALEIGYPNSAVFNRAFKQITGITPKEFRKQYTDTSRQKNFDQF